MSASAASSVHFPIPAELPSAAAKRRDFRLRRTVTAVMGSVGEGSGAKTAVREGRSISTVASVRQSAVTTSETVFRASRTRETVTEVSGGRDAEVSWPEKKHSPSRESIRQAPAALTARMQSVRSARNCTETAGKSRSAGGRGSGWT